MSEPRLHHVSRFNLIYEVEELRIVGLVIEIYCAASMVS